MKTSNVLRAESDVQVVGEGTIAMLKVLAENDPTKRSRLILHQSKDSPVQEMVICLHNSGYFRPHRHPKDKSESYHVIEGELDVRIFREDGKLIQSIRLGDPCRLYRIRGGIYHQPVAVGEWCIYHEVFTGPYDKERDVEYGPWSAEEK